MTYRVTPSSNNLNIKINSKSNIKISPINYSNKSLSIRLNLEDKLKVQTFSGGVLFHIVLFLVGLIRIMIGMERNSFQ